MKQTPPSPEAIAARAYQLWEGAERPSGRDEEFWLRAEQQLRTEVLPPLLPAAPPTAKPPPIPQSPAHAVPPVIREVVQPVARPPTPAPTGKRRISGSQRR